MASLPRAVRPFSYAQYRLLFIALACSMLGSGIWMLAIVWQVIELGGGPIQLSGVATAMSGGLLAAIMAGGVLADRVPQRRILIVVISVRTLVVAIIAVAGMTGRLELWHLVAAGLILGVGEGFYYPAYSAFLPSIVPSGELLAANGIEGMLRPALLQAAGPALAAALIAVSSPAHAFAAIALLGLVTITALLSMRRTIFARPIVDPRTSPMRAAITDLRSGLAYLVKTPWLLGTLVFASLMTFLASGPIEVLLPFVVRDQTGGGPGAFATVLAAYGIGGAIGALVVASRKLPKRYLTVMLLTWSLGAVPLVLIGFASELWLIVAVVFVVGFTGQAGMVIWGTLLQQRVPRALLGRVSSLDFFVALALTPLSMALAGPLGEAFGVVPIFVAAGAVPIVLAVFALVIARMPRDEIEHPLAG